MAIIQREEPRLGQFAGAIRLKDALTLDLEHQIVADTPANRAGDIRKGLCLAGHVHRATFRVASPPLLPADNTHNNNGCGSNGIRKQGENYQA